MYKPTYMKTIPWRIIYHSLICTLTANDNGKHQISFMMHEFQIPVPQYNQLDIDTIIVQIVQDILIF